MCVCVTMTKKKLIWDGMERKRTQHRITEGKKRGEKGLNEVIHEESLKNNLNILHVNNI